MCIVAILSADTESIGLCAVAVLPGDFETRATVALFSAGCNEMRRISMQ